MPCPKCNEDDAPLGLFLKDTDTDSYHEAPMDLCLKCGWEWSQDVEEKVDEDETVHIL